MKKIRFVIPVLTGFILAVNFGCGAGNKSEETGNLSIGWSVVDITPDFPVLIWGQRSARVSEGVLDPLTVTAMAIESGSGPSSKKVIMISCDLVAILDGTREPDMYFTPGTEDNLRDNVRNILKESLPELSSEQIIMNGTHTHTGPLYGSDTDSKRIYGIELDVMPPTSVQEFLAERIAKAAVQAWENRQPGGISYGLGHAVVGHNRLQVNMSGQGQMYGSINRPDFSHIEGFEDHSVHLMYTWDKQSNLTGVVVNIACPAQATGGLYELSADYWHETREELGHRLGRDVYILPQISASGDKSPRVMVETKAEERMQNLMFPDAKTDGERRKKQIAVRIADAVTSILPQMEDNIEWDPVLMHRMEVVNLSRRIIPVEDVNTAVKESDGHKNQFENLLIEMNANPEFRQKPRWYAPVTLAYSQTYRGYSVKERYEMQKTQPKLPVEVHVVRIGDIVFATNPFELYLDFGIRMKGRSPAVQTFVVQLTGSGTYLPPPRSVAGGSYGAEPASTLVGPEGGDELVGKTLEMINAIWDDN